MQQLPVFDVLCDNSAVRLSGFLSTRPLIGCAFPCKSDVTSMLRLHCPVASTIIINCGVKICFLLVCGFVHLASQGYVYHYELL